MTKEEAIKYLKQLYPNGGHCWLDEQRIEAISMAISALEYKCTEEPVSEDLNEAKRRIASEYMEEMKEKYGYKDFSYWNGLEKGIELGARWREEQMVKNVVLETKVYLESDGDGIESEHQEWLALENNEILDIPNNIGLKDGDKVKVIIIKDE